MARPCEPSRYEPLTSVSVTMPSSIVRKSGVYREPPGRMRVIASKRPLPCNMFS